MTETGREAAGAPRAGRRGGRPARPYLGREHRRLQFLRAILVGLAAGGLALLFKLAVDAAGDLSAFLARSARSGSFSGLVVLLGATALLGGLAAWLTSRAAPEAAGSGIPHVKLSLMGIRVIRPYHVIGVKFVGGFLALASGMSLGREGPTVQMGGAMGRIVGDLLGIRRRSYGALIASGAGAGLAAAFNAPLAGFLFVMEELRREMSALTYGAALAASVAAVAVSRLITGQGPVFDLENPSPVPVAWLPTVALVGVAAGAAGILFSKALVTALEWRDRLALPRWILGATVGFLGGLAILLFPALAGVGHDYTQQLLEGVYDDGPILLSTLLVFGGRLLFTSLAYATGVPGGIFAPMLVMGSFFGYACGVVLAFAFPGMPVPPTVFATIGMAALLTGSVRAPLTGTVLIVEMTAEYGLLYALLVGSFAAYLVGEASGVKPIYEWLLSRDLKNAGIELRETEEPTVVEVHVEPDSELDGRHVRELPSRRGALIVTVTRGARNLVPEGDTLLLAGDHLTVLVDAHDSGEASVWFHDAARGRTRPHVAD